MIAHHISDDYQFHIVGHLHMPLPLILYSKTDGLSVFLSSNFEGPEEEIPNLRKLVKEVMEGVHKLSVPIVAETKVGPNWRDMK